MLSRMLLTRLSLSRLRQVVRAFYGVLWNVHHPLRGVLRLSVVSGPHAESAVVHVHASHWCAVEQGLAPLLPSKTRDGSAVVYHVDAVAARREDLVGVLSRESSPPVDRRELGSRVRTLGEGQAALTEKALAGMLRAYALTVK